MVLAHCYVGTSQYIKTLSFIVRRCPDPFGMGAATANLGGDANPAFMIYDLMTNPVYGVGTPSSRFDIQSFKDAATTLKDEGMGMSEQIDTAAQADALVSDILRHIDGVMYVDPQTGLWTLKLARADYDPDALPEFGPDDIPEAPEIGRGSWEDTINQVKVTFVDRDTFAQDVVQADESANYAVRGELVAEEISFLGFSSRAVAQFAATRELTSLSYPFARGRVVLNRRGWKLRMGSVFKLTWPPLGIAAMIVRVTSIDYGSPSDSRINVDVMEDVFGLAFSVFTPPAASGWVDPIGPPSPADAVLAFEAPYGLTRSDEERVIVGGVRGDRLTTGFHVESDDETGSFLPLDDVAGAMPSGLLVSSYPAASDAVDATGFVLHSGRDLEDVEGTDDAGLARGDNLLYFEDTGEICGWRNVVNNGDGTFSFTGIMRGLFDTVPADHAADSRVYFFESGFGFLHATTVAGGVGPAGPPGADGADGADGGLTSRTSVTQATGVLATDASEAGLVDVAKSFFASRIVVDAACRVRLYEIHGPARRGCRAPVHRLAPRSALCGHAAWLHSGRAA